VSVAAAEYKIMCKYFTAGRVAVRMSSIMGLSGAPYENGYQIRSLIVDTVG